MRKIETLRQAIAEALPELQGDPARLRIWIERGAARSVQTDDLGFGFSYRLNLLVTELASDIGLLALAIFRWLRVNQPDLLAPGRDGFAFDVDILDNRTADVLVQLDIRENVAVTAAEDGAFALEYLDEPDPLFLDALGFGETDPIPLLAGIDVIE